MTKLHRMFEEFRQSPWLDNLKRGYITSGEPKQRVEDGIRGITSNPTIFAKAIEGAHDYDDPGKPTIAWDDGEARERLVDALVSDAHRLLGHLPEQELGPRAAEAVANRLESPEPSGRSGSPGSAGSAGSPGGSGGSGG